MKVTGWFATGSPLVVVTVAVSVVESSVVRSGEPSSAVLSASKLRVRPVPKVMGMLWCDSTLSSCMTALTCAVPACSLVRRIVACPVSSTLCVSELLKVPRSVMKVIVLHPMGSPVGLVVSVGCQILSSAVISEAVLPSAGSDVGSAVRMMP